MTNIRLKYRFITVLIFSVLLSSANVSCDPHRRGHTAKQIGAGSGMKKHRTPASGKIKQRSHY